LGRERNKEWGQRGTDVEEGSIGRMGGEKDRRARGGVL